MAYTEKVSLNGTALSFLLYECVNSVNSQEGFLLGNITSEITNHISDLQNDSARLDTQIFIRTVLPLPTVALFYFPVGKIKEDVLSEVLSNTASEVVGWMHITSYLKRRWNNLSDSENLVQLTENEVKDRSPSPVLTPFSSSTQPTLNYAAALKKGSDVASTSKTSNVYEDLINFDVEDQHVIKPTFMNDNAKHLDDSSPEY
ncbi:unnamed protein product, partial [Iphiclides podalirius]